MELLKETYFEPSKHGSPFWRGITSHMMSLLLNNGNIMGKNARFVRFVLAGVYEKDQNHVLARENAKISEENVGKLRELVKTEPNSEN